MKHRDILRRDDPIPMPLYEHERLVGICAPARMTQGDLKLFLEGMRFPPLARRRIGVCPKMGGRVHWRA
jgi:hypothetical protein